MKILSLLPVLAIVFVAGCIGQAEEAPEELARGSLQIKITDQVQELEALAVTIDSILVGRDEDAVEKPVGEETEGGLLASEAALIKPSPNTVEILGGPETVDVVGVRDLLEILAEAELEPGLYNGVSMRITSAVATIDGEAQQLDIPADIISFNHPFRIESDQATSLIIDFYADYAIELLPEGMVFSPVAEIETEFVGIEQAEAQRISSEQETQAQQIREQRAVAPPTPPPVVEPPAPPAPDIVRLIIEADDREFSPAGPFNADKGDTVRITFKVRRTNVRFGGLEMRSDLFNTGTVSPGSEATVEFTAQDSFTFRSYWPNSNRLKATALVNVA